MHEGNGTGTNRTNGTNGASAADGAAAATRARAERAPAVTVLEVPALRLDVRLGCTADERRVPQAVDLALTIRFAAPPAACWSDELADTVCYAELASVARSHCAEREFKLVERLACELHALLSAALPPGATLALTATKVGPPVAGLAGGVRFTIAAA